MKGMRSERSEPFVEPSFLLPSIHHLPPLHMERISIPKNPDSKTAFLPSCGGGGVERSGPSFLSRFESDSIPLRPTLSEPARHKAPLGKRERVFLRKQNPGGRKRKIHSQTPTPQGSGQAERQGEQSLRKFFLNFFFLYVHERKKKSVYVQHRTQPVPTGRRRAGVTR
ncbi:hypothetical protein IE53DRAFT_105261 [Violaceomyces palustris]|uniref:Uncharacterized protein n=1 Tax=Violaceomyces palustris TaxID=1673888 RepID=A0ACD0NWX1_9BASI|nr:hypothetical protein IE53DRAFT_105261 [Violaceomyces palustris]